MERMMPEILRACADALEDTRRLENVEGLRRAPKYDQQMLLALNKVRGKGEFPDEDVMDFLREKIISVAMIDQESTTLGLSYTNIYPYFKEGGRLVACIFPLHGEVDKYSLVPQIESDIDMWNNSGWFAGRDASGSGNDPFLINNPKGGPHLAFFKKTPDDPSYQSELPAQTQPRLPRSSLQEDILESNVIRRALWYTDRWAKPYLFLQHGFKDFIRANRHDPKYSELYEGYRKHVFPNTGYVQDNR